MVLVAILVLAVAAIGMLLLKLPSDDEMEVPSAGVVDLSQPELRPVALSIRAKDAAVSWRNGDAWEPLGTAPVDRSVEVPAELQVVLIRIELPGQAPRDEALSIEGGAAAFELELPAPTPVATLRPSPAPTSPRATPAPRVTPAATPAPTPATTPEPTPPPGDDDTLPTGYKDNPY